METRSRAKRWMKSRRAGAMVWREVAHSNIGLEKELYARLEEMWRQKSVGGNVLALAVPRRTK
eukprot:1592748-Pleurochrysis_carterae.AAC.1